MEKGTRVGAILSADENQVKFLGWGVYEGDEVPPAEVNSLLNRMRMSNPKIKLDGGAVVWGCKCWWASEPEIREYIGQRKLVKVEMPEKQT